MKKEAFNSVISIYERNASAFESMRPVDLSEKNGLIGLRAICQQEDIFWILVAEMDHRLQNIFLIKVSK